MSNNLLYKASIITTPTAYGVGVLNSIKPAQSFGEELIVNGNFDTDSSNWLLTGSSFWINSSIEVPTGGLTQAFTLKNSITYKITFDVIQGSGINGGVYVNTNYNSPVFADNVGITTTGVGGTYTFTFTMNGNGNGITLTRRVNNQDIRIDNVSVVEVTDADFDFTRTSSATRVNPDYLIETVSINSANLVQNGNFSELGSELVTNGNFDTDSDWNLSSGAIISNGKLIVTNAAPNSSIGTQSNVVPAQKPCKLQLDIIVNSGSFRILLGSGGTSTQINTSGTYTFYETSGNFGTIFLQARAGGFDGSIDNVSVKQVDPNDNWSLGTGWSIGTNEANAEAGSGSKLIQTNTLNGKKCKVTLTVSNYGGSGLILVDFGSVSSPYITSNGTHTVTGTYDANNFEIFKNPDFVGSITDISVIEIQENGVPRLDYTNGTASILLENQSTNLIPYSQDFGAGSFNSNSILYTANTTETISPSGNNTADKFEVTTSNSDAHRRFNQTAAVQSFTLSVYIKGNKGQKFQLFLARDSFAQIKDINVTLSGGWQRIVLSDSFSTTSSSVVIGYEFGFTSSDSVAGQVYYLWGAQLEALSYPTSYIPTSGSTVTRAAETLNNAGNSDLINSTEGVLYAETSALANDSVIEGISISDGTINNRVVIFKWNTSNSMRGRVTASGVNSLNQTFSVDDIKSFNKIAISYAENNFAIWLNGVEVFTDTSGAVPVGLNKLQFDSGGGGSNLYGRCKTVAVFSESLSDTELACLTSTNNREIFLNYYYRMQYVGANTEAVNCAQIKLNV